MAELTMTVAIKARGWRRTQDAIVVIIDIPGAEQAVMFPIVDGWIDVAPGQRVSVNVFEDEMRRVFGAPLLAHNAANGLPSQNSNGPKA